MASGETINLETLLAPIGGDFPAGINIRDSNDYYDLKDARREARDVERRFETGDAESGEVLAAWRKIETLAPPLLAEKSKDLDVVAWLIEALLRLHGFSGLSDGFTLVEELVKQYWGTLLPEADEDGISVTLAPLAGLNGEDGNGTLIAPIRATSITLPGAFEPFALWHYRHALEMEDMDEELRERRISSGAATLAEFESAVRESGSSHFRELIDNIAATQESYEAMCEALQEACGENAPPSSRIREVLDESMRAIRVIAKDALGLTAGDEEQPVTSDGDPSTQNPGARPAANVPDQIASREDALVALSKVADYYRQTEPHSPVSYLVEKAIRWGRMNLPELLAEVVPDDSARRNLTTLTGVRYVDNED